MKVATFVLEKTSPTGAVQRLYSTPDGYIVASAIPCAFDTGRPETYLFPADSQGNITEWGELPGSFRGDMDHERAMRNAGYEVTSC